jgi:hypothetical protein
MEAGPSSSPQKRQRITNGYHQDYEEEVGRWPREKKDWEKLMLIWRNTILMISWSFPQNRLFDIDIGTLDRFYDFLKGENILGRNPQPPIRVVQEAERLAWKKITFRMHGEKIGAKLAMEDLLKDSYFWTREIFEKVHKSGEAPRNQSGQGDYSGNTRRNKGGNNNYDSGSKDQSGGNYNKGGNNSAPNRGGGGKPHGGKHGPKGDKNKGKPDGKAKGGGKHKGGGKDKSDGKGKGPKSWPSNLSKVDWRGKPVCAAYHFRTCPGGCNKEHSCGYMRNGKICGKTNHWPCDCNWNTK